MFPSRYFPNRYWTPRYWPDGGGEVVAPDAEGIEYTMQTNRMHYDDVGEPMQATMTRNRLHYAMEDEN